MTAPAKRGPGRPPLAEGEPTRWIYVRLPEAEHEAAIERARALGVSASAYAREAIRERVEREAQGG